MEANRKARRADAIERVLRRLVPLTLLLLAAAPAAAQGPTGKGDPRHRIEGTWRANLRSAGTPDAEPVQVLFTFLPGRQEGEGTLIDTNSLQQTGNPVCTPDQGSWRSLGEGRFIATHYNFCFDPASTPPGAPAGPTKIRDEITLNRNGRRFTVRQYVEGFDPEGHLVFTDTVTGVAERIEPEAPPAG